MTKNIAKSVTTRHKRQWTIIEYFKLTVMSSTSNLFLTKTKTKPQQSCSVPNVYFAI